MQHIFENQEHPQALQQLSYQDDALVLLHEKPRIRLQKYFLFLVCKYLRNKFHLLNHLAKVNNSRLVEHVFQTLRELVKHCKGLLEIL